MNIILLIYLLGCFISLVIYIVMTLKAELYDVYDIIDIIFDGLLFIACSWFFTGIITVSWYLTKKNKSK